MTEPRRGLRLPYGSSVAIPLQVILVVLLLRCFHLQIVEGARYERGQIARTTTYERVQGARGRVLTRDGVTLAEDTPYWKVAIDPFTAGGSRRAPDEDREQNLRALLRRAFAETPLRPRADRALLERESVRRLRDQKYYYFVGTLESIHDFDRFSAWRKAHPWGRVFTLEERARRRYPRGQLAAQLVGPLRSSHEYWGVEAHLNRALSGHDGLRGVEIDGRRRALHPLREHDVPASTGPDLVLTIDSRAQRLLERNVRQAKEDTHAQAAAAVVMDPHTGAILAMASCPSLDGEDEWTERLSVQENRRRSAPQITQLAYEPGSTIKPLIFAEAITRGIDRSMIVKPHDGRSHVFRLGRHRRTITDVTARGPLDVDGSIVHSSNIGLANVGRWLGRDGLANCLKRFELGRKTGLELPEERGGTPLDKHRKWRGGTTLSIPFGYELMVTPLQLARAYCAIANGGYEVAPYVVARRGDESTAKPRGERILSADVAREVRRLLREVVVVGLKDEKDTIQLAGKTGTAKKVTRDPTTGKAGYWAGRYRGSFIGFAPVDNPRYLMMMLVDEPQGEQYFGGSVARPVVLKTLTDLLDTDQGYFRQALDRVRAGGSDDLSDVPPERRSNEPTRDTREPGVESERADRARVNDAADTTDRRNSGR